MGIVRTPSMRSEDYLDAMINNDYMGGKPKMKVHRGASGRLASLTCLQFAFAVYATFLLYYMSPVVNLRTKPDFSWATRTAKETHEMMDFLQKKSNDTQMIKLKRELYDEVLEFQRKSNGTECLSELMVMSSKWDLRGLNIPRITVILNHFKRKTLCWQLDSLLQQTLPFHSVWVLSFGSLNELSLKRIVDSYNDSRISFIGSSYDFKNYGRFQMVLQTEADIVYILDDDMIPGTEKYKNSVLGSIGRILPFRQKDYTFPTAYDITVERIVPVDFLSNSYCQLQKYRNAGSFVHPVDTKDRDTCGDNDQWWRALSSGYLIQWAAMYPQKIDALFYAHSHEEVKAFAPLLEKFRSKVGKKAYIAVPGGSYCPFCREKRFKIFDLGIEAISGSSDSEVPVLQAVYSSMKGQIKIHNPSALITVSDIDTNVKKALKMALETKSNSSTLILLPRSSVSRVLWMADLRSIALPTYFAYWNRMRVSFNIITQDRATSFRRLLKSLSDAYYVGDEISISFNMDSKVDEETVRLVNSFQRIIQGGLIRAVSESWYPSSNDDFGLLLEDDIEVSAYYYLWIKYVPLAYHYDPQVSFPELSSISLYTPRLVEVIKERPKWNATEIFNHIHPNTPYLHQLPCSWGSVSFPKHWREFYVYMNIRFTLDAKQNPVQIPKSRTNVWQASWKKFLIDMMYLRGYVSLYLNFPNQESFSTNHMEPGAHISAKDNVVKHDKADFEVPLLKEDFQGLLPGGKLPPASKLPSLNLFYQAVSLKGLKAAGAKLGQDVIGCNNITEVVAVDNETGLPGHSAKF
ncbi:hypothetical protein NE237_003008 [Protea cynaroides]|uniref:Uncharacterized protein n=1 Tax=Protea cynaroides TaxID=273540 RepID=A0A9Q0KGM0_9MAGN|nr:hypothetical protein NE237_003008 [Protea cynaroides]